MKINKKFRHETKPRFKLTNKKGVFKREIWNLSKIFVNLKSIKLQSTKAGTVINLIGLGKQPQTIIVHPLIVFNLQAKIMLSFAVSRNEYR